MHRRIAVRAIIVHKGKLLAVQLKPYGENVVSGIWCTVGGGVDEYEGLIPSLKREVIEETGIEPVVGNLLFVQQFRDERREHLEFFFHVTNAGDFLSIDLSNTTHGVHEIDTIDFIDTSKTPTLLPKFLQTETFENIHSQPTKFFDYL